ncbi:GNAT family N-acetyltransferase [Iodobacter sp. LRB]|uniref:GNAT family N-acetyltransferase n=1 Tax=unclassified Iodobacter TaxID=235634 RepID=UPI000C0DC1C5|nr:GNAT family N-acetyltransferase [Iodobacter sp. BJB302]PHV03621.1 GNAT family N-acetyltransferase [Iodobacter sp. BJB302]
MLLNTRPAVPSDIAECIVIRGKTRENAISKTRLAELGITEASWAAQVESGELLGRICLVEGQMAGYCFGSVSTGEIVVLALLPDYENQGMGKALLQSVMSDLKALGHARLFLGCAADPEVRSFGFYRHLGWRSTGQCDKYGDEVLEYVFATSIQV